MKSREVTFPCGELMLEGALSVPEGAGRFPAVIVCHPHPLYGGSMENNVVDGLCDALDRARLISFKFNFRGVGGSQGKFSHGTGEEADVSAAISFVSEVPEADWHRIGLAGYSAGAGFGFPVGVRDARIKALAAVSPPLSIFALAPLGDCLKPKLLIAGSRDDLVPAGQFQPFCRALPAPVECVTIEGADHFWWGFEPELAKRVSAFFARVLDREA